MKKIITFLFLLLTCINNAHSKTNYNSYLISKPSINKFEKCAAKTTSVNFLTTFGITTKLAASAYSLRKLDSNYNGNAIQIRRSSDNTTLNIGFTISGDLDNSSILTFVGTGNGFVTIWYDQSGNSRDLAQTTISKQPIIVSNGFLVKRNGRPTVFFDAIDDGMVYPGAHYLTSNPITVNLVAGSNSNTSVYRRAIQGANPYNWLVGPYNNTHSWYAGNWNHQTSAWSTSLLEYFTVIQPASNACTSFRNGTAVSSGNNKGVPGKLCLGAEGGLTNEILDGYISEVVSFNEELSTTERQSMETSQANYYLPVTSNANLAALTLSSGSLNPVFAATTTTYSASVSNATSSITVTPTKSDVNATIQVRINGGIYETITSGLASSSLALNAGNNTIEVLVSAQDGTTFKTYTITVLRSTGIYYVNSTASGAANGASWTNASSDLQSIINNAFVGEQIWVAAGTYYPTRDYASSLTPSDARTKTFTLKSGVALYGGFSGTETLLNQRISNSYNSILSGDIGTIALATDNCYHVVLANNLSNTTIFDGFTVRDGNANVNGGIAYGGNTIYKQNGGGLYNANSTYTISSINFINNTANDNGGAMMNSNIAQGNTITINDCSFVQNKAVSNNCSGAIYTENTSCNINRSVFDGNIGGGISSFPYGNYVVDRSVFVNHSGSQYGGATRIRKGNMTFRNTVFANNTSDYGGVIYITNENNESSSNFYNCTFFNNVATISGRVIFGPNTTVANSVFDNNIGTTVPEVNGQNGSVNVTYSLINASQIINGSSGNLITGTPLFSNTADLDGADNIWKTSDDGLMITAGSAAFNTGTASNPYFSATDIIGTTRPQFGSGDLGAYESAVNLYSSNADLSSLTISSGTLAPTFDASTMSYTASVSNATSSITLTPTKSNSNATIRVRVNGGSYAIVASGNESSALNLNLGINTIDVQVTAQDGTTIKIYTITVTRIIIPATHLSFDGVNDYVNVPDSNSLDLTSNYTIEAWINVTTPTSAAGIVSKYQTNGANGYLLRLSSTSPYTGIDFDGLQTANGVLQTGVWYHVAAVKNGSSRSLYINGILQTLIGTAITTVANSDPLKIGSDFNSRYFNGSIDEVRIWNSARTSNQISNSKNCELQGNETGLVTYYKFNQGNYNANNAAITTLTDATSNGNNGTLNNFALSGLTSNWQSGSLITTGVAIPSVPVASAQYFCGVATVANLVPVSSSTIKWYNNETSGIALSTTAALLTGTYYVSEANSNGCESEKKSVSITVGTTIPSASAQSFCGNPTVANLVANGTALQWYDLVTGGTALTNTTVLATGTYYVSQTVNSCESDRVSVSIIVTPNSDHVTTIAACDTYTWANNAQTYTESGTYTGTTTNCVTEKLVLNITPSSDHVSTIAACDSYVWNGTTYNTSGTYTGTTTNCVTEKLVLTITPSSDHVSTISACDSYTWNGTTYNTSGTYIGTTTNCLTEKLVLTITPSSDHVTIISVCDTYTWANNGQTYTNSGIYTGTTANCVTEKLVLTITSSTLTLYSDTDGDGFGDATSSILTCIATTGYVANNTDCNDANPAINPGHVEVLYNGIDDNCDGNLDEGHQLTTKVKDTQCATTLATMGSIVYSQDIVNIATAYRYRVVNNTTGAIQYLVKTDITKWWFQFNQLAAVSYATAYTIDVELQVAGTWLGYYGTPCVVNSPTITGSTGGATLNPAACGITLASYGQNVATNSISGATAYRIKLTDSAIGTSQTIDRPLNWFNLTMFPVMSKYATTYIVEVAIKTATSDFGAYGLPCSITTPAVAGLSNCGAVATSRVTTFATPSKERVISYRFELTNTVTGISQLIDRPTSWFNFSQCPSGFVVSTLYSVRIAYATVAGVYSDFGAACTITSPAALVKGLFTDADDTTVATQEFKVLALPNPFTSNFGLDLTSFTDSNVTIQIYDMIGKLLESREVKYTEVVDQAMGDNYPSGVYNVIVSQGVNEKMLRVVKR